LAKLACKRNQGMCAKTKQVQTPNPIFIVFDDDDDADDDGCTSSKVHLSMKRAQMRDTC
jgi:hypothetical protein